MIGCHTEIGMLNEDITGRWRRRILGKQITGTKLCVPNQIRLRRRHYLAFRLFKKVGLIAEAPRSIFSIEEYLEISNLKVIAIIRNGNDVVSSIMRRGGNSLKVASRRWSEAVNTIYDVKQRYSDRVLVLTFEGLVTSPEVNLKKICNFLDVCFEERMLEGYKYTPRYQEAKINEEKVNRYKNETVDHKLSAKYPMAVERYDSLVMNNVSTANDAPTEATTREVFSERAT